MLSMRVRILGHLAFFMCASAASIVDARTLHVGDKVFNLSQTQYTTPSLACKINNETWYAPMTKIPLTDTLHLRYNNTTYSVCEPFTDTTNYTYDNDGRLIGADENLWIQSTNGGYIDTGIVLNSDNRIQTKFYNSTGTQQWFFGARNNKSPAFGFQCPANGNYKTRAYYYTGYSAFGENCNVKGMYIVDMNKNVTTYTHPNGNTYSTTQTQRTFSITKNLLILCTISDNMLHPSRNPFYYMKVYNNGTLVRDLVPVPACMRIGDFIVPENGMWDIVNQRFYGNANTTGTIIYGKDE